ncbi:histidyl-tRNA synthetase [Babesia gibsoni]|uniref:histidine--tRNA ligase n=1 Tax=Babesia gibsoni TaxID=33632 RepID=A0AAD8PD36_BABGI|nr:histidyl-tRNA synthetase [Babesia gibsoni]
MAKVVLNSVRLLSMEELYSVALAKRPIVLDPDFAKLVGVPSPSLLPNGVSPSVGTKRLAGTSSSRESLIGRMICCALLQKAVRSRPHPSPNTFGKLVDALNSNKIELKLGIDGVRLGPHLNRDITEKHEPPPTPSELANFVVYDSLLAEVVRKLGISPEDSAVICKGRTSAFATVAVIGVMVNTLSKFSDCVVGLACETLKLNRETLTNPDLQKVPNCVDVVRHLIWLTEDSKIDKTPMNRVENDILIATHVVTNGEAQQLSKAMMKISSDMIPEICGSNITSCSDALMEGTFELSLKSHVSGLCRCMASAAETHISIVVKLIGVLNYLHTDATEKSLADNLLAPHELEECVSEYEQMVKDFKQKQKQLNTCPESLHTLADMSFLCRDILLVCASLSTNIMATHEQIRANASDKRKAAAAGTNKLVLGHGNNGFYAFISEFIPRECSKDTKALQSLKEAFGGYGILHHIIRIDSILVPRNQQVRRLKVPKGTVDFLPDDMLVRSMVMDYIRGIFKQHGACEIDTPVFELRETLMGKYGDDQKLIFDLKDSGGEQLSLRYDLTVPFARFLGSNKIDKMKRFHIGKVYRRDEPQINRGRFREFVQCDLDYAGVYPPMVADAEVIFILIRVLRALLPDSFRLKISHRVILDSILNHCGVAKEMHRTICSSIDKLDKETWTSVREEMVGEKGLSDSVVDKVKDFVEINGSVSEVVELLRVKDIAGASEALDDMSLLSDYLSALGVKNEEICFDLSLARGLDYYTGVIFEAVLTKGSVGSVGAGGRYDDLIRMLSGRYTPAVGMSVGIERIMKVLTPSNASSDITDVFVCTIGETTDIAERLRLCSPLWLNGVNASFHYNAKANLRRQLDAATAKQAQIVVIVGKSEAEEGVVRVKILSYEEERTAEEFVVPRDEMVDTVRRALSERGDRYSQLEKRVIRGMNS